MNMRKKDKATAAGVGAVACLACCVGPIVGFLAAIGIGTAAGFVLFGTISLVVGAGVMALVMRYRTTWSARRASPEPVAVELSMTHSRT